MNADSKTYRITLDGKSYTGTGADVARWYCKQKGIKLFIIPEDGSNTLMLGIMQKDGDAINCSDYFDDNEVVDLEAGYQLFFTDWMQTSEDADFVLAEAEQQEDGGGSANVAGLVVRWKELVDCVLQLYKDINCAKWQIGKGSPNRSTLTRLESLSYSLLSEIRRGF